MGAGAQRTRMKLRVCMKCALMSNVYVALQSCCVWLTAGAACPAAHNSRACIRAGCAAMVFAPLTTQHATCDAKFSPQHAPCDMHALTCGERHILSCWSHVAYLLLESALRPRRAGRGGSRPCRRRGLAQQSADQLRCNPAGRLPMHAHRHRALNWPASKPGLAQICVGTRRIHAPSADPPCECAYRAS
jgi:hypothetical protein